MTSKSLFNIVNEVLSSQYDIIKPLGRGAFGTVFLVKDEDDKLKAMKRIPWHGKANYDSAIRESRAFSITRNHAHIVECIDGYADQQYAYIVMEYCDGGSLSHYLFKRAYDLELNVRFMMELADAVSFLHHNDIIHRDLKPRNIVIKLRPDGTDILKVTGFSVAATADKKLCLSEENEESGAYMEYMTTVEGTEAYVAPEAYKNEYTFKMDIFSMGIIFMAMLEREVDGYCDDNQVLVAPYSYNDARKGKNSYIGKTLSESSHAVRRLDSDVSVDDRLRQMINSMLHREPDRRPNADEIYSSVRDVSDGPHVVVSTGCCHCRRYLRRRGQSPFCHCCFNTWCCFCILFGCF
ncbi:serine/threonine-protein kinase PDIK1L-like [Glandiceps talaboti]